MTKDEIRRRLIAEREQLTLDQRKACSLAIAEHLWVQPEYLIATALHVYLPVRGEVDTRPIIERAWKEGKHVFVPVVPPNSSELHHAFYSTSMTLIEDRYGIPVPAEGPIFETTKLAEYQPLVLVPLIAFDRTLRRVGYGKGFYDRFLANIPFVRFGLAFAMQFVETIPHEEHDQPLDAVITEHGIVRR